MYRIIIDNQTAANTGIKAMQRICALFVIVILSVCNLGVAGAEPVAGQRDLVRDAGLDVIFQDLSSQIKGVALEEGFSGDAAVRTAWIAAANEMLSQKRLEATMRAEFATMFNDGERAAIYKFLDSPLGRRVRSAERQAMEPAARAVTLSKGKEILSSLKPRRAALLARILNSTGGRESSITMGVSIMTAMAKGMKIGGLFPETVDDETLDRMIVEQKPMVVASVDEQLPATLAFTYHPLPDQDLERYLTFLKSDVGVSFIGKVIPALERVVSAGVTAFGIRLALLCGQPVNESDL